MNPTKGLWLVPTYGRAQTNIPRFIKACSAANTQTPIALVVDEADYAKNHDAYDSLGLPMNFNIHVVKGGSCAQATREAMAELFTPDMEWLGWLGDDHLPETPHWDLRLIKQLTGMNIVSSNDGSQAPKRATGAICWSGDLLRAIGYIYPAGFSHTYIDDLVETFGKELGVWSVDMDVMVRHRHASDGGRAERDDTFLRSQRHTISDDKRYQEWRRKEKGEAIERVLAMMQDHGVIMTRPNLKGMEIMLAVPTGDGKFESVFQSSYVEARDAVRQFGGELYLASAPYISDIALARSKLFGAFLRSDATHLFWVDADQGFSVKDFIRLLIAGKDFVAAAGVRKVFPPSFAVRVADDDGKDLPINQSAVDGLIEVTGVGFAFVCLSRACCVRMQQSYVDLAYEGSDGRTDYAVFNPIVHKRRYLSEDFAFCYRWRQLGGKIFVAAEIDLDHVGSFTWNGAWLTQLITKAQAEQAERAEQAWSTEMTARARAELAAT